MTLLDQYAVRFDHDIRVIELWEGDILEADVASDADSVLVVSAFPGDYAPIAGTVIGGLARRGVSVAALAGKKGHDFRDTAYAWVSGRTLAWEAWYPRLAPGVSFRRILCFEPPMNGGDMRADWVVDGIFRALLASLNGEPTEVTLPLVATGNRGLLVGDVLPLLLDSAAHWMATKIPLRRVRLVERDPAKARTAATVFAAWKAQRETPVGGPRPAAPFAHDIFLSYRQKNASEADGFVATLRRLSPSCRVFRDTERLEPGMPYQRVLNNALYDSKVIALLYTPEFFASPACLDELNAAFGLGLNKNWFRVFPVLVRACALTDSAQRLQYVDCRDADPVKLENAAKGLLARVAAAG